MDCIKYNNHAVKVFYKKTDKTYFFYGAEELLFFTDVLCRNHEVENIPAKIEDIYYFEENDDNIILQKGDLIFDQNDLGEFYLKEDYTQSIIWDKLSKTFTNRDDIEITSSTLSSLKTDSIRNIANFMIRLIYSSNEYVYNELIVNSDLLKDKYRFRKCHIFANLFKVALDSLEGCEKLLKSGNKRFLQENIAKENFEIANEGKLNKVVQIPKFALDYLKKYKVDKCYDIFKNINTRFNGNDLKILVDFLENMKIFLGKEKEITINNFCKDVYYLMDKYNYKIKDLLNYLLKQNFYYSKSGIFSFPTDQAKLLKDYLDIATKNSIPYEKFSQNLEKTHDIVNKNVNVLSKFKGKKNTLFKESVKDYSRLTTFDTDYIVKYPESIEDLVKEGNELNHCVGSYADKVLKGTSKIFFIRKFSEPNISHVTVELNEDNELVQAKGNFNQDPDKDTLHFIKKWVKKITI